MTLVVPDVQELAFLTSYLTPALTLRLYSNNVTPAGTNVAADFTEVTGGGYANLPLTFAHWSIVSGDPTTATYDATQQFSFTGTTGGAGTVYGYYVTRNSDGLLMWSERFPSGSLPFSPINGSIIRILPKITADSL